MTALPSPPPSSPPPSSPPVPSFCCGLQDSPSTLEEVAPFAQGLLRGTVELVKLDNDAIRIQVLEALTVIISVRDMLPGAPHPPPTLFYSAHLSCLYPMSAGGQGDGWTGEQTYCGTLYATLCQVLPW